MSQRPMNEPMGTETAESAKLTVDGEAILAIAAGAPLPPGQIDPAWVCDAVLAIALVAHDRGLMDSDMESEVDTALGLHLPVILDFR